jgi:hypothetical protein
MKIIELLENIQMPSDKARDKLSFDLKDDLEFFMRNDDDFYRRHYYPHVVKCKRFLESGKKIDPKMFEKLVNHAYECYTKKFPIRELPDKLEENLCEKICQHLHTEELKHIKNKVY